MTAPVRAAAALLLAALAGCASTQPTHAIAEPAAPPTPAEVTEALRLAQRAYEAEDIEAKIALYRQSIQAYPDFYAAWNNLGSLLMAQERWLEADEAFAAAARLEPRFPEPVYNRGLLRYNRFHFQQADDFFDQALDRDPSYLPALRGAVHCDVILRETTDETLANIERALEIEPDPEWRRLFELQQIRVRNALRERPIPRS